MSFPLEVCQTQGLVRDLPGVNALLQRLHERPAYQAALKQGGPYAYAK
jgi:glutathione S-transferase